MPSCDRFKLARRFAAMFYDALLLAGVLFFAFIPFVALFGDLAAQGYNPLSTLYMVAVALLYFGWQWTHGGQTLGMKTWKIRVVSLNGGAVSWRQATLRFFMALVSWAALGLGYIWAIRDPDCLTWHDRVSGTRMERTE